MLPQTPKRKQKNTTRVNLLISLFFHTAIVAALLFFAARQGFLGEQFKKIAIEMIKEKPPEKPKEPEKPKAEPLQPEPPKTIEAPKVETAKSEPSKETAPAPPPSLAAAPAAVVPPAADLPSFVFGGGQAVQTGSSPVQLYKGSVEHAFLSRWRRPVGIADDNFVAEVEVAVDQQGQISDPVWKKSSGDSRWDASVRQAIAETRKLDRSPPPDFPARFLVRFDVQDDIAPIVQNQ
jgi:outer membrane biosynthesis protein TonB